MQLNSNTELQNGKFRILRVLGQGGFGITYLAENVFFDRLVAIKEFFPKDFCGRDETTRAITSFTGANSELLDRLKKRFLKEARNIAALDHPGIVKIHDIFEENGTAYYVMDYINGENLNEMVKREGAMTEKRAVGYIKKVGEALSYIHARNMTHFDVKPANIVVRRSDDMPILIDFGLSKQYDIHGDATSTLLQGASSGYSPLEMYNPAGLTTFSPQTDIYSLGATLVFLLTGQTPAPAMEVVTDGVRLPSNLTPSVKTAIETAMKASRSHRGESMEEFLTKLGEGTGSSASSACNSTTTTSSDEGTRVIGETPNADNGGNTTPPPVIPPLASGSKNPGSAGKPIFGIFIGVVVILGIVIAITVSQCNSGNTVNNPVTYGTAAADTSDYVIVVEDVEAVEDLYPDSISTYPNSNVVRVSSDMTTDSQIKSSSFVMNGNQKVHFYKGNFYYNNTEYPVLLAFIQVGNSIDRVVYKNITYGGKVRMNYSIIGNDVKLYGRAGTKDFTIYLYNSSGNQLTGQATEGSSSMPVKLWPTNETFDF